MHGVDESSSLAPSAPHPRSGAYMRLFFAAAAMLAGTTATAQKATMTDLPQPPRAEQRPSSFERHGIKVDDPYAWLRDKGYPKVDDSDVLDYLKAENAYF